MGEVLNFSEFISNNNKPVKNLTMLGYLEHEYIGTDLYIMVTDKAQEEMYMYTIDLIKEEK